MDKIWEATQVEKSLPKLNNPILIEGLPGIGNVGKIAVDFLIEELKAKKLYSFFSYRLPHSVFVNEKNLVEMPKLDLYYKQFSKGSKKKDLLFLIGDIQPIDEESCYAFCDEILEIAKQLNCKNLVTTGGIGLQHVPEKPKVYCAGNDQTELQEYVKKGMPLEKKIFGVVGPIMGVSGILLALGKRKGVKGVALLAETFGNPFYLGIKGAREIVTALEKKFSWGVSVKKISKEIMEVENQLLQKASDWLGEESAPQAGAQAKKKDMHYIG